MVYPKWQTSQWPAPKTHSQAWLIRVLKHTPVFWRHQWNPITFVLLFDDFGVEYVGERHARHLQMALEENYAITMDQESKKYSGIDIK